MNTRLIILSPTGNLRYGSCILKSHAGGWVFVPNVPGRRGSRKVYPTAKDAIPRWAKPYTALTGDVQDARNAKAYCNELAKVII